MKDRLSGNDSRVIGRCESTEWTLPEEASERDTEPDFARATGTSIRGVADNVEEEVEETFGFEETVAGGSGLPSPRTREEKEGSETVMAFECLCWAWCSSVCIFSCFLRSCGRLNGLLQTSQMWGLRGVCTRRGQGRGEVMRRRCKNIFVGYETYRVSGL